MATSTSVYHLVERGQPVPFYTGMSENPRARMGVHVARAAGNSNFYPVTEKIREVGIDRVQMIVIESGLTKNQAKKLEGEMIANVTHVDLGGANANHSG